VVKLYARLPHCYTQRHIFGYRGLKHSPSLGGVHE
jgi:hypothetical protein